MLENYHDKESASQKLQDLSENQSALDTLTHKNEDDLEKYSTFNIAKLLIIGGIIILLAIAIFLAIPVTRKWIFYSL